MSFTLKKAKHWRYIKRMVVGPPFFKAKINNNEDQIAKIYI